MQRRFDRLREGPFDLLVVGGGIYGAWIAYDAALRGLSVALIEKRDWAAGTSSASSKLIHGGLRYLQYFRLGLVRTALRERERLIRLGPHRISRLDFVLPVYAGSRVGRFKLKVGLWLYDRLAGDSHRRHRALDREQMLERHGFLEPAQLRGGFTFADCQTDDARFVLEIVDGAMAAGAVAVNRAEATELIVEQGRVAGARVVDREGGETLELRTALTVNCAGPWVQRLLDGALPDGPVRTRLSKGVHLVMPPLPTDCGALLISDSPGRVVFLMPWYGRTLLGTTDTDFTGRPDDAQVEDRDVEDLLAQANAALAGTRWTRDDVQASFCGLRTLPATTDRSPSSVTREWLIEEPLPQLLVSIGGKLTSARADASVLVSRVERRLGRKPAGSPTVDRPLPWCPEGSYRSWFKRQVERALAAGLDEGAARSCLHRHGCRVDRVLALVERRPELAERIVPGVPFCLAEAAHAVEHEMALDLRDVLERRVPLLLVTTLPQERALLVARMVGQVLGWSEERIRQEVAGLAPVPTGATAGR